MGVSPGAEPMGSMPLGVLGSADVEGPATITAPVAAEPTKPTQSRGSSMGERPGLIEIDLPNGLRIRFDLVNER